MPRSIRPITVGAALLVAGAALWMAHRTDQASGARLLVNRVWVERMPEDSRDVFGKLLVLETPDGKFGVVGRSSTWTHHYEVFLWRLAGDRLTAFFPQHAVRDRVKVRTWACEGEAPEPFELCLEVSNDRGRARFYSMRAWEVRPDAAGGEAPLGAGAALAAAGRPAPAGASADAGALSAPGFFFEAASWR